MFFNVDSDTEVDITQATQVKKNSNTYFDFKNYISFKCLTVRALKYYNNVNSDIIVEDEFSTTQDIRNFMNLQVNIFKY
jgi:hypothetical protein